MWLEVLLLLVAVCLLYAYLGKSKDFWEKYGVRQLNSSSFWQKASIFLGYKSLSNLDNAAYQEMGRTGESYVGVVEMQRPILIIRDLEIIKKIMIKDFDYFTDRRDFGSLNTQKILGKMLSTLKGEEWKGVRGALSPTFTTGKIRRMMGCFNEVSHEWIDHFNNMIKNSNKGFIDINVPDETTRYTVDVIAASVFGLKSGSIADPQNRFSVYCLRLAKTSKLALLKMVIGMSFPKLANFLKLKMIDDEAVRFFVGTLNQGMRERLDGIVKRNDFLQLMAEARKGDVKAEGSDELSGFEKDAQVETDTKKNWLVDEDMANAQLLQFFFAGFSTTSNFIGFCLYCLALNQEVQEKLRDAVKPLFGKGNDIDYDELNQLNYLEMFACEVLRHYPPLGRVERICVREYHDPQSGLKVPKGALMAIPADSIHHDSQYYERPNEFYPEHFTPEKKSQRNPYVYLPFGVGPRNCIGMRFALIQSKAAVAHIVYNYKIEPATNTPIPLKVKPIGFGVQIPDNLELRLSPAGK